MVNLGKQYIFLFDGGGSVLRLNSGQVLCGQELERRRADDG